MAGRRSLSYPSAAEDEEELETFEEKGGSSIQWEAQTFEVIVELDEASTWWCEWNKAP